MRAPRASRVLLHLTAYCLLGLAAPSVPAQPADEASSVKRTNPGMDHGSMNHGQSPETLGEGELSPDSSGGMELVDIDGSGMDQGTMQGGSTPSDARDPHAYSGGYGFGPLPRPHMADEHSFGSFLADRLELARAEGESSGLYDARAWYGRDYSRVWFKGEGEIEEGELQDAGTELHWGRAVAAYWDMLLGVRYDGGEGPDRGWLALGIQGLAPYWFELEATAYVGGDWRTMLRLEAEYELLLTQRLVLQPRLEAVMLGKNDLSRGLGKGLSSLGAGLRLRYEIRREFAPYIGVERAARFGETADLARAAGGGTLETRLIAGLRFWF